jgi:hypothetical protein
VGNLGFRLLSFGDVLVCGDPPASPHGAPGDYNAPAIRQLEGFADNRSMIESVLPTVDVTLRLTDGKASCFDPVFHHLFHGATRLDYVWREAIHLNIAAIAQDQPAGTVEHR